MTHFELAVIFFLVALIYSTVGFGGGSSYLAILALYHLPFREMRLTALVCNIIVVTGSTVVFIYNKQVDFKKILPIVLTSVPFAFLGAALRINQQTFFIVLGLALIVASILLWIDSVSARDNRRTPHKPSILQNSILGGGIGFLSGMVGIGGGIFLSPLLNLKKWDTPKKIAATATLFILVNSTAGIAAQVTRFNPEINYTRILFLALAVFAGGQVGSRIGVLKFDQLLVKRATAFLVLVAGIEVLTKHLHF